MVMTPALEAKLFAGMNKTPNAIMVTLPWPNRSLSPNARVHWRAKAAVVKSARLMSFLLTREQLGSTKPCWPSASVEMVFCPPDKRRRDADNLIAATKAHRDGIADALGIDDSLFITTYQAVRRALFPSSRTRSIRKDASEYQRARKAMNERLRMEVRG